MSIKAPSSTRIVTGIFSSYKVAGKAIAGLIDAGFDRHCLSVVGADSDEYRQIAAQLTHRGADSALIYGSLIGTVFGAVCGWFCIMWASETRYFYSIVPLMAALTGAIAGAYFGLLTGGIMHFDKGCYDANVKSEKTEKGVLVSVSVNDSSARINAENVLEKFDPEEILVVQSSDEHSI